MLVIAAFAWYLALAAKAVAIWRLLASGIYKRLPVLFVYFWFSFIQQAGFSLIWHRPPLYAAWYIRTEPLMLALDYAMVVSLYWAVAEFFPRFRIAGAFVLSSVSLVAAVTAYLTRAFGAPPRGWETAWQTMLIYQRGVGIVLIAVLAAARLLTGFHKLFPIRTCALRAWTLCFSTASSLYGAWRPFARSPAKATETSPSFWVLAGLRSLASCARFS